MLEQISCHLKSKYFFQNKKKHNFFYHVILSKSNDNNITNATIISIYQIKVLILIDLII